MLRLLQDAYADTSRLTEQLEAHPEVWNTITLRTEHPRSPHREIDDIWVRYNPIEHYHGDMSAFNGEHAGEWYPSAEILPEAKRLAQGIQRDYLGNTLGAVLITKIPAGKRCYPHIDQGWHAGYYEKFALQVKGNKQQTFHVAEETLRTKSGDLFEFDNSIEHWVLNPSDEDRITMIVCIRRH
jgi:hypothetical protein